MIYFRFTEAEISTPCYIAKEHIVYIGYVPEKMNLALIKLTGGHEIIVEESVGKVKQIIHGDTHHDKIFV
jgi:hypothetical protein